MKSSSLLGMRTELKNKRVLTHCFVCLADKKLRQHRVNPVGTYSTDNVIAVCERHHKWIHKVLETNPERYKFICAEMISRNWERVNCGFLSSYW